MTDTCKPHDLTVGCAVAIICERCHLCLVHCTCPPEELRSKQPKALAAAIRTKASTRKMPAQEAKG